jgi:hypothetical protein
MIDLKAKIEKALSPLVGLDLVSIARSAESEWFTFAYHENAEVVEVELAPFALHVSCPWRLLGHGDVLTGSDDHLRPAEEVTPEEDSDCPLMGSEWRSSGSEWRVIHAGWIDVREQQLCEQLQRTRHSVSAIELDASGWFRLILSSELVLEVFPDASRAEHDEVEFWRLFQPGLDASHLVMTSNGVDRV